MPGFDLHVISALGILLAASLILGIVAEFIRLPRVTAFLLAGLLLGPYGLGLISTDHAHSFDLLLKLAMACVLFGLGCQFPMRRIIRILPRTLKLSAGELCGTFLLVSLGLPLCGMSGRQALLLGCVALATAPATTLLVLRELRSEGPITERVGVLVVLSSLAAIFACETALVGIQLLEGGGGRGAIHQLRELVTSIGGAIGLGIGAGLVVSYGCGLMAVSRWLPLIVATITFGLGLCETFELPYMLTFLAMGLAVANSSVHADRIARELDQLRGLLTVLFFAVHGSELDLSALTSTGLTVGAYIVLRFSGKLIGTGLAARLTREPADVRKWLGLTLLAQADAAIALATLIIHRDPGLGRPVMTVILGSVVVFEIAGPLLIRLAVLRAGEVPLAMAIHHSSSHPLEGLRELFDNVRVAVSSLFPGQAPASDLTIEPLIHRGVQGIPQSATFPTVITRIERSRDNTWPVVDDEQQVIGVIRYPLLSNVIFDPDVSQLVCAEDLATPADCVLHPDDTVTHAADLFGRVSDDCLPVVTREEPHRLLGIIRRSDVTHLLIRRHSRPGRDP